MRSFPADNHVFRCQRLVFGTVLRQRGHNSSTAQQETPKSVGLPPSQPSQDDDQSRSRARWVFHSDIPIYDVCSKSSQIGFVFNSRGSPTNHWDVSRSKYFLLLLSVDKFYHDGVSVSGSGPGKLFLESRVALFASSRLLRLSPWNLKRRFAGTKSGEYGVRGGINIVVMEKPRAFLSRFKPFPTRVFLDTC